MIKVFNISVCRIWKGWNRQEGMRERMMKEDKKEEKVEKVLKIYDIKIIKNVYRRDRRGGKPIILVDESKYFITELSPNVSTLPIILEVTWVLITAKIKVVNSKIRHIVIVCLYYTEKTKKCEILDHLSHSFKLLRTIYGEGMECIFLKDFNKINEKTILNLSKKFKENCQVSNQAEPR